MKKYIIPDWIKQYENDAALRPRSSRKDHQRH